MESSKIENEKTVKKDTITKEDINVQSASNEKLESPPQKDEKSIEKKEQDKQQLIENNLTISTKLSTEQLICKSPRDSPASSRSPIRSITKDVSGESGGGSTEYLNRGHHRDTDILVYLGLLQMLFGIMMVIFGVLVLVHDAALSQTCGGIWGGCVALTSGLLAIAAAARECCPLRPNLAKLALTSHLAFSLISLAVANLVLVFAAIGIEKDLSRTDEFYDEDQIELSNTTSIIFREDIIPVNSGWAALLANFGLLITCACEFVTAAISSWRCSRLLCPCFQMPETETNNIYATQPVVTAAATGNPKDVLVSAWLGLPKQQTLTTPLKTPSTLPRQKGEVRSPLPPLATAPSSIYVVGTAPRKVKKQLIPAPLRPLSVPPSSALGYPVVRPPAPTYLMPPHIHKSVAGSRMRHPYGSYDNVQHRRRKRLPSDQQLRSSTLPHKMERRGEKAQKRHKERRGITEEEVVRTYTGLDRTIAEQFIVHCDTNRNHNSINSKSDESGQDTSLTTTSDVTSNQCLVEKL